MCQVRTLVYVVEFKYIHTAGAGSLENKAALRLLECGPSVQVYEAKNSIGSIFLKLIVART